MNEPALLEVLRTTRVRVQGIGQFIQGGYGGLVGQLTEARDPVTRHRFWVRESIQVPGGWFYVSSNHRWGLKGGGAKARHWIDVLELAVAPEIQDNWDRIAELVHRLDSLHRPVRHNARWTAKVALRIFQHEKQRQKYDPDAIGDMV